MSTIEAPKRAGEIAAHADCTRLAVFFWIGWEGAVLRAKVERGPEPLDRFAEGYFTLVERQA